MVLALRSVTKAWPLGATASPSGSSNVAAAPGPSVVPLAPGEPASVVTTPADEIWRIVALPASLTQIVPPTPRAGGAGLPNRGLVPGPSTRPAPSRPASVETFPADTFLIMLLLVSATMSVPEASRTSPTGKLKVAVA